MPVPARSVDCAQLYRVTRRDLIDLVIPLDESAHAAWVPATPAWSVHDVICHLVGIPADMNAGNFGNGDPNAWTAHQVQERKHTTVAQLAAEWEREAPQFEKGLRIFGYEIGSHYVADLLQHSADIRHALHYSAPQDAAALPVALDFYLMSFEQALCRETAGAVQVTAESERWTLGEGALRASVEGGRYELFRALGGRRADSQIRALSWEGDVTTVLEIFSQYPRPDNPIIERT